MLTLTSKDSAGLIPAVKQLEKFAHYGNHRRGARHPIPFCFAVIIGAKQAIPFDQRQHNLPEDLTQRTAALFTELGVWGGVVALFL